MEQPMEATAETEQNDDVTVRRSNRTSKPVIGNRLVDAPLHELEVLLNALTTEVLEATNDQDGEEQQEPYAPAQGEIFAFSTLFPIAQDEDSGDPIHAYAASADPDTLYHHEAMREPDAPQFMKAMEKEFIDQWENGNFSLKKWMGIPEGA